ncbi:MAG: Rrf2 family transcriptional regulator [Proteobacteria bacterium]|nr:Rrf2 family transcriptional regulator [Pseudomonadota bacterium]
MRLTSFTDFGLRMLMRMAGDPERAFSTAELAVEFGLSRNHLAKIMQRLAQAGIVETRRGGGGGAILARAPDEISIGEVVRHLEAGQALVDCFPGSATACSLDGRCRLKSCLHAAEQAFLAALDRQMISEIALESRTIPGAPG